MKEISKRNHSKGAGADMELPEFFQMVANMKQ